MFNPLRPRLNRHPFADDILKCIFLSENEWILPRISHKFVPKVRINNIPALVQKMAWRRPGDKPLSEPMMVSLLTHICVTRPQWVNVVYYKDRYSRFEQLGAKHSGELNMNNHKYSPGRAFLLKVFLINDFNRYKTIISITKFVGQ